MPWQAQIDAIVECVKAIGVIGIAAVEEVGTGWIQPDHAIALRLQRFGDAELHQRREVVGRVKSGIATQGMREADDQRQLRYPGAAPEVVHAQTSMRQGARVTKSGRACSRDKE